MALPGIPQTFAIESAQDMAEKLNWEVEAYREEADLQPKLWRAFNCAVTAWHISDWLWKERQAANLPVSEVSMFQAKMQAQSRYLRMCKHIATASKHSGVDRRPDPTIQVIVRAKGDHEDLTISETDHTRHWEIIISDAIGEADALEVFLGAQQFWDHEIRADEIRSDPDRFAPID